MDPTRIAGFLLDLDGTLVDTETLNLACSLHALESLGLPDAAQLCESLVGIDWPAYRQRLFDHYGADFPLNDFGAAYLRRKTLMLQDGLPLKPGVVPLLSAMRESGRPMAIATSSHRRSAHEHLALGGIDGFFDVVVTRDDVDLGKPDPALYLLAAQRVGLAPADCLAVEDSIPGVTAAHAAGVPTLMVPDMTQPPEDIRRRCLAVLPDLHAVLDLLRREGVLGGAG